MRRALVMGLAVGVLLAACGETTQLEEAAAACEEQFSGGEAEFAGRLVDDGTRYVVDPAVDEAQHELVPNDVSVYCMLEQLQASEALDQLIFDTRGGPGEHQHEESGLAYTWSDPSGADLAFSVSLLD